MNFLLLSLKRDQFCWVKYVSKITGLHGKLFNTVVAKILDNWQASVILPKKIISFRLFQLCVYCKKDHNTFHWVLFYCAFTFGLLSVLNSFNRSLVLNTFYRSLVLNTFYWVLVMNTFIHVTVLNTFYRVLILNIFTLVQI